MIRAWRGLLRRLEAMEETDLSWFAGLLLWGLMLIHWHLYGRPWMWLAWLGVALALGWVAGDDVRVLWYVTGLLAGVPAGYRMAGTAQARSTGSGAPPDRL